MSGVHFLQSFAPDFSWQRFVEATPGVAADEAMIGELWRLARPQVVWRDGEITARDDCRLTIDEGALTIDSAYVAQGLAQCQRVTALAVSLGPALPEAASRDLHDGALYRGTIADMLGSYGVELLADDFCAYLSAQALPRGQYATLRYSPGYGDWPLTAQRQLVAYLDCPQLPLYLTEHDMLEPVKSITALLGWSAVWQKPQYPSGHHGSGFCNGGHNCAACTTWACRKGR